MSDGANPAKKRKTILNIQKHKYPVIPPCADDEVSVGRNLKKLKEEVEKPKGNTQVLKELMARTLNTRTEWIRGECPPLSKIFEEYPLLKKATYVGSVLFFSEFRIENLSLHELFCRLLNGSR